MECVLLGYKSMLGYRHVLEGRRDIWGIGYRYGKGVLREWGTKGVLRGH